jgi:hypothetical protein
MSGNDTPDTLSDVQTRSLACAYGVSEDCQMRFAAAGVTPADIVRLVKEYGDDVVELLYEVMDDYQAGKLTDYRVAPTMIAYLFKYRDRLGKALAEVLRLLGLDRRQGQDAPPADGGIAG